MGKVVIFIFGIILLSVVACEGKKNYVPKPSTYLELNLPERSYDFFSDSCGYSFNKPSYFNVKNVNGQPCNRDVDLSSLNGTLHLSRIRSEEHTSELQSRPHLVCRLLLEKKKNKKIISI